MAEPKTRKTQASVDEFIAAVAREDRRADAQELVDIFRDATGEEPAMWGPSIIGFGSCVNEKGVEWMRLGFSPRAAKTSIYILSKPANWDAQLARLGKHEMGKGCMYVKKLDDIDRDVLRELVADGWKSSCAAMP